MFSTNLAQLLPYKPYKTDTQGVVTQTLNGVFVLLSDELVQVLKDNLTQEEKDELQTYVYKVTAAQAAEWNIPIWAGEDKATYLRIPAAVWNDPNTTPPAKVKKFFHWLWNEANEGDN